jgi:geranylgeranyl diphosphate synthase, type II
MEASSSPISVREDREPRDADRAAVEQGLAEFCDRYLGALPGAVGDAIRYSLLGGGKRLRAMLLLAAYRAVGGSGEAARLAAAVEIVHAYSLVHDDLPCMDDDELRRGFPTVHKVFGVPVAIAAGLAMVPLAARAADSASVALALPLETRRRILLELMRAAGAGGMIGGQLLDLEGEGAPTTLEDLERTHRCKTGALIAASTRIGALAAGADVGVLAAIDRYGDALGLAFQIADDVLDVTATSDELGKTAGRDAALRKSTYPSLLGVDGAMERARSLADDACGALRAAGLLTPRLEQLSRYIVARRS